MLSVVSLYWNVNEAMPEPPVSVAPPERVTVPMRVVAGLVMVTLLGAVLSTRRFTTVTVVEFAPLSIAVARRSYRPFATPVVLNEHE